MLFRAAAFVAALAAAAAGLLLAPAAQASSQSVQVNGNQLKSALLPASDFGSGFHSQATSSGGSLLHGAARSHISSMSCGNFEGTVGVGTFGETAFAVRFINSTDLSNDRAYFVSVVQFASNKAAASYYSQAYAKYARCTDFTVSTPPNSGPGGGSEKFTLHSISKTSFGAYQAFRAGQSVDFPGSPAFSLRQNTLVAVAGTDIFYIVFLGAANDLVSASLMGDQIGRVQRLR